MKRFFAGIDIGSAITKVVIMGDQIVASVMRPTSPEHRKLAHKVMEEALVQSNLSFEELSYFVATGYGRINVPFAEKQITEISCHARGVHHLFPTVKTVIDVGGQDSKGIKLKEGKVVNFVMNDKCAAGTGRFLEVIAVRRLGMVGRLKVEQAVVMTGGGAKNMGLIKALETKFGCPMLVPPEPLLTGAIGAALLSREFTEKAMSSGKPPVRAAKGLKEVSFFQ